MLKIGITGGIGCGKSFVCRKLQELGMVIFDCDREAKRIMETLPDVVEGLKSVVGEQVYTSEGRIDKRVMSDFLFANVANAAAVSAIVHPAVGWEFLKFASEHTDALACVMESAILVESGLAPLVDKVICVQAPLQVRLKRVQLRDGLDEASIRRRIDRQMAEEERRKYPFDCIIVNDGQEDLAKQLSEMLRDFKLF